VYLPDGFLSYMSGGTPKLVANSAGVVAPNTLHVLRLDQDSGFTSNMLAAIWQTSLTRLSTEIEGHSLGGGMLKLEPSEAERVLVPIVAERDGLESLATDLDEIARSSGEAECQKCADDFLLRQSIGLSAGDVRLLRDSALLLRERRVSRSVSDERH
jgi:hypothetical protein